MMTRTQLLLSAPLTLVACATAVAQTVNVVEKGLLPGDALVGPATNSQSDQSIAKGGEQYLVAWTDYRARSSGSQASQSDVDIFGIRLDSAGSPIDAAPFLIAGGMGFQQRPKVAWNGENWLVVYESQDPTAGYYDTFIRTVRVSPQGQILDPTPVQFPPHQFSPSTIGLNVSGQGGQWLVTRCVYHGDGYGTLLAGQRVAADGHLVDAAPVMLNDWVYGQLSVIAGNGEYLVVGPDWNNSSVLKARRIGPNLQPLAPSFNLPPVCQSIAGNGAEYYVTWVASFTDLVGSRMTSAGSLLNPSGTLLFPNFSGELSMTNDGTNWWLSKTISNTARTMRISPSGAVLDPGGVPLPIVVTGSVNSIYGSRLAPRTGGGVVYLWSDYRESLGSDSNVFSLPISGSNAAGTERCVSTGTRNQRNSDVAEGPAGITAVAYVSEVAGDDRVLVQMLSASGNPLSAQPFEVGRATSIGVCGIAWNGAYFMITWDQSGAGVSPVGIVARRMNSDGTFVGSTFAVMPGMAPSIEALGEDFCVAGTRFDTYPQFIDLWANRIDGPTGAPLDGPNGIRLGGGYFSGLTRTRTDGTQWLIATHSQWSHDSSQGDAVLAKVPAIGAPTAGFNPTPFSGGTGDLDIAFSGSKYLLVWRSNTLSNANNYVSGRIMNADGTFATGAFTIAEAAGRQLRPTVTWDGSTFVVMWDDQRNQQSFYDTRTEIYAARVRDTGALVDAVGFPAVARPPGGCSPSLLSKNGVTLVASTRFATLAPFDSYRIGVTILGTPICVADVDDGSLTGTPDGGVSIEDLLFYLSVYGAGDLRADVDNGTGTGTRDGGVGIEDLLYYLLRFDAGC